MSLMLSDVPPDDERPKPARGDGEIGRGRLRRVLLVEDDYFVATDAEAALLDAGFEVIGLAGSAEEAIALALAQIPELVVMDIRLTGARDGIDAAHEIFRTTGIRCLFATAHSTPEILLRAETASPIGWLPKPYTQHALVAAVRTALANLGICRES